METVKELPTQPSKLIRVALADLRACEDDDRYVVDMSDWHAPTTDDCGRKVCSVCLAGAVLAQTLDVPREQPIFSAGLRQHSRAVKDGLYALDCFRRGALKEGLRRLKKDIAEIPPHEEWEQYGWGSEYDPTDPAEWEQFAWGAEYEEWDPDKFHAQMLSLADYFEAHDL